MDFDFDMCRKPCLLKGLDDIDLTPDKADFIREYEKKYRENCPWLFGDLSQYSEP